MAADAIKGYLESLRKYGDPIPRGNLRKRLHLEPCDSHARAHMTRRLPALKPREVIKALDPWFLPRLLTHSRLQRP
jgi:hypothetical protein